MCRISRAVVFERLNKIAYFRALIIHERRYLRPEQFMRSNGEWNAFEFERLGARRARTQGEDGVEDRFNARFEAH